MSRSVASSLSSGSSSSSSRGKRGRAPSSASSSARPATVEEVGEDVHGEDSEDEDEDVNEGGENEEDEEGEESEDEEDEEETKPSPSRLDVSIQTSITDFSLNTGMNILIINERPNLLAQEEEGEEEEVLPVVHLDIQQVPREDDMAHLEGMRREKEEWKVRRVDGEEKLKVKMKKDRDFGEG
ncbi:hypothetical protein BTUL_0177g00140 [Botrytis tulipae]|uniref:Uncharacterized protein n=1 Tax=Botrytis tulipae TaxID=87230 RepID=A0A4Z1EAB9_9HELO|nr:hypothetical protein BTUL_0177g00140 [Botrytis tulipae]